MEAPLIAELSSMINLLWVIFKVAAGLGFVIFVHELGHFLVAKFFGVKCEKFYIGFDVPIRIGPIQLPQRLARWQWGETEYGVGIIPLGGYVKMLGQDDNPANAAREAERIRLQKAEAGEEHAGDEDAYELDPRSYPAKSVPARMAIISAGVIMNLIFAVIFAGIAFRVGVNYTPCEIGYVAPGSPAWKTGLRQGDKIIQMGKEGEPSENLWFDWDLRQAVGQSGIGSKVEPLDIKVRRASGKEEWIKLTPSRYLIDVELAKFVSIGIAPVPSTKIANPFAYPGSPLHKLADQLRPGGRIVAVDGKPLDRSGANEEGEFPGVALDEYLVEHADSPVRLTIEYSNEGGKSDSATKAVEVTLPAVPRRGFGIICKAGPIYAVRVGSPAAKAGLRKGDRLVSIDGKPLGDPLTLNERLQRRAGETVAVVVRRGDEETEETFHIELADDNLLTLTGSMGSMIGVNALGVAFPVRNVVADVVPDSPADKRGIRPGDELLSLTFVIAKQDEEQIGKIWKLKWLKKEKKLGDTPEWVHMLELIQRLPASTKIKLSVRGSSKGAKERKVELTSRPVEGAFVADRGLILEPLSRVHRAETLGASFAVGTRFVQHKFSQVIMMVQKLVTGQWSMDNFGGPLMIATIAGREASEGTSRLLVFLTFLSVNLAILNFLPIPALDGGHMVFLAIEGVTGRPVNENVQGALTMIGVLALLGLILYVTASDLMRAYEAWW